MGQKVIIRSWW